MYSLKRLENGFDYVEVQNSAASAKIALLGAHLFFYKSKKSVEPLLWVSEESRFEEGVAIRGGIPLCWPRFGNLDKKLPQHGFVRTKLFELVRVEEPRSTLTQLYFRLNSDAHTRSLWEYEFTLEVIITIGQNLTIEMISTNRDTKPFMLTQAFHTYFAISEISNVTIYGLENISFINTLNNSCEVQNAPIKIRSETDRVYENFDGDIILEDLQRILRIRVRNLCSVIVWNPWREKCSKMSDMCSDDYKKFCCIESANAFSNYVMVRPGESQRVSVTYDLSFSEKHLAH
jgi:glucose-6-phosphate 1-epimerase